MLDLPCLVTARQGTFLTPQGKALDTSNSIVKVHFLCLQSHYLTKSHIVKFQEIASFTKDMWVINRRTKIRKASRKGGLKVVTENEELRP
jgi:HKD family nuclease